MSEKSPFIVVAMAAESDTPAIKAAAEQLSLCMSRAAGEAVPVKVQFVARDNPTIPAGNVFVAMLTEDVLSGRPIDQVAHDWRARLERVRDGGPDRALLCTLFRRVSGEPRVENTLERIRRLNKLVIDLSRELDSEVVDVDRFLALCGGRTIGADYRCSSQSAARLAAQAITAAILDGDLVCYLPPDTQQRAIALHGGVRDVERILVRHIGREMAA